MVWVSIVALLVIAITYPQHAYALDSEITESTPVDLVNLPKIINIQPEDKDGDFTNPETVAGDEEIIPVNSSNTIVLSPSVSVQPVSQNATETPSTNRGNLPITQANTEETGEVLSVQTNESTDPNKPVEVDESKVTDTPSNTSENNPAAYWWYLLGGVIGFIGLVVLILFLRR